MKRIGILLALVLITSLTITAQASDVTMANFHGTLTASNPGAATGPAVLITSINATDLSVNGYCLADYSDIVINQGGYDSPFMVGYNSNPWTIFTSSAPAGTSSFDIYTGGATGGLLYYFPDTAGMSVADSPTMRPGAIFLLRLSNVYIDTNAAASKYLASKYSAGTGIKVYVSDTVSGNITAQIDDAVNATTVQISVLSVYTGEYTVDVYADGLTFYLHVYGGSGSYTATAALP